MEIRTAIALAIGQLNQPVITSYDIARIIFRLYQTKNYKGEQIDRIKKNYPVRSTYNKHLSELTVAGVLQESKLIRNPEIFTILGKDQTSPEEAICCVDPFAYISHMSAMEWHGLTDRIPKMLFVSSPEPVNWRKFALEKMQKDLGDLDSYIEFKLGGLPLLRRLRFSKVGRKALHRHASMHLGAFTAVRQRALRVATIGRTFLDMIKDPDLCGGIYHVIDAYEKNAAKYLRLIVDEVDRHGNKIDKVRAGYILEERLGLDDERIKNWQKFAQRGGSRKLDAHGDYSPTFSEKWCLSLNIEE